jgi:hypothetical protein
MNILLIHFNRSQYLEDQLSALENYSFQECIYISIDGPRAGNSNDLNENKKISAVIENYKKRLNIKVNFSRLNQGCRSGVLNSITWFFSENENGVIFEDDIVFNRNTLDYFATALKVESNDVISGFSPILSSELWLSQHGTVWGWATYATVWDDFMNWQRKTSDFWSVIVSSVSARETLLNLTIFCRSYDKRIDTWDYDWNIYRRSKGILSLMPRVSVTTNVGFTDGAHMQGNDESWLPKIADKKIDDKSLGDLIIGKNIKNEKNYFEIKNKNTGTSRLLIIFLRSFLSSIMRRS